MLRHPFLYRTITYPEISLYIRDLFRRYPKANELNVLNRIVKQKLLYA